MSTETVKAPTLEERITVRLHESIGELMTPEDLKGIVERGVDAALFKPRTSRVQRSYGSYDTQTLPPLLDELVEKHIGEQMRAAVDAWLTENPELIQDAIDRAMTAGVGNALLATLDNRFAHIFSSGVQQLQYSGLLPRTP